MTVAELISALQALPPNLPVVLMDSDHETSYDLESLDQGAVIVEVEGGADEQHEAVRLFPDA